MSATAIIRALVSLSGAACFVVLMVAATRMAMAQKRPAVPRVKPPPPPPPPQKLSSPHFPNRAEDNCPLCLQPLVCALAIREVEASRR